MGLECKEEQVSVIRIIMTEQEIFDCFTVLYVSYPLIREALHFHCKPDVP